MANFVLTVDEWRQATKFNDADVPVRWVDHKRGDVIDLDPESDDAIRLVAGGALREATDADSEASADSAGPEATPDAGGQETPSVTDQYDDKEAFSFDDLKNLAGDRGLSKAGSREDVIARLREFDQANA